MTRFVTLNGITKFDPGGLTKINATALAPIGLSATGILALVGESDGGAPGTAGIITIDDPSLAKSTFRSGALADAIRVAFDPGSDIRVPGGAFRVLVYKTNASTQSVCQLPGATDLLTDTAAGSPTTTVIELTTATSMAVDEHVGRWFELTDENERRRIVSNGVDSITVDPGFSVAPSGSDAVAIRDTQIIFTSRDYGVHTNQISVDLSVGVDIDKRVVTVQFEDLTETSPEIVGDSYFRLKYLGGAIFNSIGNVTAIDATGLLITTDLTAAGPDDAAGMTLQFDDGTQREVITNTTGASSIYTLISGHALSAEKIISLETAGVSVRNVTTGTGTIVGASGVAISLTTAVLPVADDLSLTFTSGETLRTFVDRVNATTNYEATILDGINGDTTLMSTLDFGTRATAVVVRFDDEITPTIAGSFRRDLNDLVAWFNDFSTLLTAVRATTDPTEGSELPTDTDVILAVSGGTPIFQSGAIRGLSTNTNWQDGFDAFLNVRANNVVPLISADLEDENNGSTATLATVAAQLLSHVQTARGTAQSERGGFLGMAGTLTAIVAQAAALNDTDVQLLAQKITTLNVDGVLTEFPEWGQAVSAAGMRSGVPEVGEPLTFKLLKTTGLTNDSSWDSADRTNRNALLQAGVMFAEAAPVAGFRWVRDLTTHLADDNIAFIDAHTRDAVRFIAYDLRTFLEDRFTGLKATPATVASIREAVAAKMAVYLEDNIIVESLDPENLADTTKRIPGFRRLKVSITGNVATVKVEIFPVTGIVFQLSEIFLQLPRITAG